MSTEIAATSAASLVIVPAVAVAAPLIAAAVGRAAVVPLVVFEILLGIIVGPSLLGWVDEAPFTATLAELGLATLFFMAGSEIEFSAIAGRPLVRAALGWVLSLGGGIAVGLLLAPTFPAAVIIAIALSSTALGTLIPVLRDAGEADTPFGHVVKAIGAVGEFGPLLAISLFLSGREPLPSALILIAFAVVSIAAIVVAARGSHVRLHRVITATLHTSGQFAVRLALLLVLGLVALTYALGLDILLGAFAAGVLWRLLMASSTPSNREALESKLDAVAFGFLVPVFFIYTGITFDLDALLADPAALALVPVFALALLVVRGLPGLIASPPGTPAATRGAVVLLGATGLPIIVAVTQIGVEREILSSATAAALVGAGMLTVLIFPALGLAQRRRDTSAVADAEPSLD